MIVLIQTDFPLPVEPAIKRCGIFVKSATTARPVMSFPRATGTPRRAFLNSSESRTSPSGTSVACAFGTSMPTADFPGIGASMRICVAASAIAISFCKLRIRLTFTPIAGSTSYCVTVGPTVTFVTRTSTPKLRKVVSRSVAFFSVAAPALADASPR